MLVSLETRPGGPDLENLRGNLDEPLALTVGLMRDQKRLILAPKGRYV